MHVVTGPGGPGFVTNGSKIRVSTRSLRLAIDALLLCTVLWGGLWLYANHYQPLTPVSVGTVTRTVATTVSPAVSIQPAVVHKAVAAPSAAAPPLPQCTPDHSYQPAGALALSASRAGLHTLIDSPHYYRVYGYTSAQIRQQIIRCTPTQFIGASEAYSGQTDFWMGWSYNYVQTATACQVTAVAVGFHVTQTYPEWQPAASAQPDLAAQWQTFMANLITHEQGHVSLDTHYAQTVLHDLQSMSAPTCSSLIQQVTSRANHDVAALNAANDDYDARTHHGQTQGAILP